MMLKIKESINLAELEKFDYDDFGVCYKKYGGLGEQYFINKRTREITRIHPYSFREIPTEDEIFDLVQAGLIEKVDDKE